MRTLSVGLLTILQAVAVLGVLSLARPEPTETPRERSGLHSDTPENFADLAEDLSSRTP